MKDNNKFSLCPHLIEGKNDKADLCRLKHIDPVLSPSEVELYCKSASLNTCRYLKLFQNRKLKTGRVL
jgi:hypothetical protein